VGFGPEYQPLAKAQAAGRPKWIILKKEAGMGFGLGSLRLMPVINAR
jgi:hypothetical protein